jgi:hypothetical protein
MQQGPDFKHHQIGSEKRSQIPDYQELLLKSTVCVWIEKTGK